MTDSIGAHRSHNSAPLPSPVWATPCKCFSPDDIPVPACDDFEMMVDEKGIPQGYCLECGHDEACHVKR